MNNIEQAAGLSTAEHQEGRRAEDAFGDRATYISRVTVERNALLNVVKSWLNDEPMAAQRAQAVVDLIEGK